MLLGGFGDPGHLFPLIALGLALRARGHTVHIQSWRRWQGTVERLGLGFLPAPEYPDLAGGPLALGFYEAARRATAPTVAQLRELEAELVVADILTLAPALAAELCGLPFATVIPHPYPLPHPGHPPFSVGARHPRGRVGAALWRLAEPPVRRGLERGRDDLNGIRRELGLPPRPDLHGGLSDRLVLVATFPQLEYPRSWPDHVHVVGPLIWEPPSEPVGEPPGEGPLVLVAPSTSQDRGHRLLRAALSGLAGAELRVLATWNGRPPSAPLPAPGNALVVGWLSYGETMAKSQLVICHGGHGTLARALALGRPVLSCPVAGDMFENSARLDWAGCGLRLPRRLIGAGPLRAATVAALADRTLAASSQRIARWYRQADPPATAARLVEGLAQRR